MKGLQTHTVTIGDSLQKLARMYNVEDWQEIAEINNLEYPYLDTVFQSQDYIDNPRVAKIGDTLIIPSYKDMRISVDKNNEELEAIAYGSDYSIYDDEFYFERTKGDLNFNGIDIKISDGIKNLSQQLLSRLNTQRGALLLHPDFGSDLYKYQGKLDRYEVINKIKFEIERCLKSDFRVDDVKDIEFTKIEGGYIVKAKVIPIEPGKPFELEKFID